MRTPAPRAVGDLLTSALPQISDRLIEFRLRQEWVALVGRDIARRSRPDTLQGGTLRVIVDNSPWLHELKLREAEIAGKVRERFADVRALRLTLGTLGSPDAGETAPAPKPVPLTAGDRAEIETAVSAIADTDVADTARRLLTTARRFPRLRQAATATHRGARGAV